MKKRLVSALLVFVLAVSLGGAALAVQPDIKYIDFGKAESYYALYFSEGLAEAIIDGNYGFIDKNGKIVIEPKYYYTYGFCEGLAAVCIVNENGYFKWGFIDKTGKVVVPLEYDSVCNFSNGFAAVWKDGKMGFVDKTGKLVVPTQYESTWEEYYVFDSGRAVVPSGKFEDPDFKVIDETGKTVFSLNYDYAATSYSEGMLVVGNGGDWSASKEWDYRYYSGGKYGFVDTNGKEIVAPIYDYVEDFHDGIAVVWKDNRVGAIDKTGKVVVPIIYLSASERGSEGLLCVCNEDGLWGYVDYTGKVVIDFKYDWCSDFNEGYVNNSIDYRWGLLDKTGKVAIPFEYDMVYECHEGLVAFSIFLDDGYFYVGEHTGYMDTSGRVIIDPVYDYFTDFSDGVAIVMKDNKYGIISKTSIRFTGIPTASTVLVNGSPVAFDAYNINDNNYFKLRDLAYVLSGTGKQFEVSWDQDKQAINLITGKPYTAIGGEMSTGKKSNAVAQLSTATVYINGEKVQLTAYNIDGNNYFKLRDLGKAFDFGVIWDGAANTIRIDTSVGYSE